MTALFEFGHGSYLKATLPLPQKYSECIFHNFYSITLYMKSEK